MIRYRLICGQSDEAARPDRAASAKTKAKSRTPAGAKASVEPKPAEGCGYEFESWFQNSDAFETLVQRGQLACPACGSAQVGRALMAPSIKTTKGRDKPIGAPPFPVPSTPQASATGPTEAQAGAVRMAALSPEQKAFVETMRKVRDHVLKTSENVGPRFVEEARRMHYDETEARSIHGEASLEEAKALAEEGIEVFPVPVLPDDRN